MAPKAREALLKARDNVQKLTEMEGLVLHRISLEARFVEKKGDIQGIPENAEEKEPNL